MDETSKTKRIWRPLESSILQGRGIDIGCGPDPLNPQVRRFDQADGDANRISDFIKEEFDFVYSSHCLEHMHDPRAALAEWWKLVRPSGHLLFLVPDEDLYEQGVFPSRFNPDHKATFTLSKAQSWSPRSVNVLELARSLPGSELVDLTLHDHGYDRSLLRHGDALPRTRGLRFVLRAYRSLRRRFGLRLAAAEELEGLFRVVDQTRGDTTLAQIQCIVRKRG